MSLAESSTVTKPTVNLDVEVSSETSFSQKIHKEGMSRGTRDTNLASNTEAENTAKGKTSEHPSGFSATDAARKKSSRKRRIVADSDSEFSDDEFLDDEYTDLKRFHAVPKHDEFKWDPLEKFGQVQIIISRNLSLKKIYRKAF